MLIAKKRDDADPMVGQPTPKEAERIRKEILRLRGIPEVDRYIAKAGEEGSIPSDTTRLSHDG
jgi:hypothetical protein